MNGRIYRPDDAISPRFPEAGRLRIGMKSPQGFPMSIDWFRATGKYAELFHKALGEKPDTLQIIFYDDTPELVCNEQWVYRDAAGARFAYGDGQIFDVWNGKKFVKCTTTQIPDLMQKVVERCPTKAGMDNWKVTLTMRFIVPAVSGVIGYWQFVTQGAASSVNNIRNSFDAVQMLRGTVTGSVFDLSVKFHKSNKPGQNSRYPVVSLVANDTRVQGIREMLIQKDSTKNLLLSD